MFKQIEPKDSFPEIEKEVLKFWEDNQIFEKSVENRPDSNRFVFWEGPPYANAKPGIHHILARASKDVFNRYKTMKGFRVERRAGWDSHGLPVEVQIEKELGFKTKKDIENYGIAEFNKKCKESVLAFKVEFEEMTRRMGYWIDLSNPYVTYENSYIESAWAIFKMLYDKGLVYSAHKVVPHCPRCVTTLSSHEVAQGYREVEEASIFIKLKRKGQIANGKLQEYFLVWTTTPWTLPANVALAVNPDITYVKVSTPHLNPLPQGERKNKEEILILAKNRLSVLGEDYEIIEEIKGQDLVGMEYEPLYPEVLKSLKSQNTLSESIDSKSRRPKPQIENAFKVVAADFVTTEEGTGIVHIAPAFGADDMIVGIQANLPVLQPVDLAGHFTSEFKLGEGKFVKDVDETITKDLEKRGLLFKVEKYTHDYPFCWRCDSPILYYAKDSWFIKMSKFRDELLKQNKTINWVPAHIKEGRFGEWLANVEDWAISRERFWGIPIPIWICEKCGAEFPIGSIKDLEELAGKDLSQLDLHRPFVDEITFDCANCKGKAKRVPFILDIWYDSGVMPYACWHWPFENQQKFEENFPADFVSEGIDQTRGWFYTLHALATVLFEKAPFKNVVAIGMVLDKNGKKMSKSRGNIVLPEKMIAKYSADAVRWYFYSINSSAEDKRFDEKSLGEIIRKTFIVLWNVYGFFATYANLEKWQPSHNHLKVEDRPILDRYIMARLHETIKAVDKMLEAYDFTRSSRLLEEFINELSTWYLRRSRKRFSSEDKNDKESAFQTLHEVLVKTAQIIAPFAPFFGEELYQRLAAQFRDSSADLGFAESVHLTDFPHANEDLIVPRVLSQMKIARKIVEMAHSARAQAKIKVRQPLASLYIHGKFSADEANLETLEEIIKDEVNVKELIVVSDGKAKAPKGFVAAKEGGYTVAIDTKITSELKEEGLLREMVRLIQDARKKAGCKPDEKVGLLLESTEISGMIKKYENKLKIETNLEFIEFEKSDKVDYSAEAKLDENDIWLGIQKF